MGSGADRLGVVFIELLQLQGQPVGVPQIALGVAVGLHRLVAPLDPAAAVADAAFLLHGVRRGEQEDLGLDVLGLGPGPLPEHRGVGLPEVEGRQPLQLVQGVIGLVEVGGAHRRVHAPDQHALDAALAHGLEQGNPGIARTLIALADLGQVVVGEVVLRGGRLPPEGLEQADEELGLVDPEAGLGGLFVQIILQGGVGGFAGSGHVPRDQC